MTIKEESVSGKTSQNTPGRGIGALIFISSSVSCFFYLIFYHFAPVFWAMGPRIRGEEITPLIRGFVMNDRDGIEGYVLYFMMFAIIFATLGFWKIYVRLKSKPVRVLLLAALMPTAAFYIKLIGFHPPMGLAPGAHNSAGLLLIVSGIVSALVTIEALNSRLTPLIAAIFFMPAFFIASTPLSWYDLSYVLDPALKLVHGINYAHILFMYDILFALCAALYLKLGIDPALFQIVGQISFYLFIIGIYLFSRRLFINKRLSIPLLVCFILVKVYASPWDPTSFPQTTPLRLDLWFVLVLLIYYRGLSHWSVGFVSGALVLLHRAFGLIYAAAYIQLILLLLALDLAPALMAKREGCSPGEVVKKHFFINLKCVSIIAIFFALSSLLLGWDDKTNMAMMFQKIGIGFIKTSRQSFYWYVPILFGALFVALISKKEILPERYFTTGLFLIFVGIGNSMYFFGRSHENNIISISGALILCLFLFLDIIGAKAKEAARQQPAWRRMTIKILPYAFILLVTSCYQDSITSKGRAQHENLMKRQLIPPSIIKPDLREMKKITHNSQSVYFMTAPVTGDFQYYYYGGYVPAGFWSPNTACAFTKDLTVSLQELLDKGYYLVADREYYSNVVGMPKLTFGNYAITGEYLIVWK